LTYGHFFEHNSEETKENLINFASY
jgi:hypothetical protein